MLGYFDVCPLVEDIASITLCVVVGALWTVATVLDFAVLPADLWVVGVAPWLVSLSDDVSAHGSWHLGVGEKTGILVWVLVWVLGGEGLASAAGDSDTDAALVGPGLVVVVALVVVQAVFAPCSLAALLVVWLWCWLW